MAGERNEIGMRLTLDAEEMRAIGHRTVDRLVEWLADPSVAAYADPAPAGLRARLAQPARNEARDYAALLDEVFTEVVPHMVRNDHPGAFGFVPGCTTWPGALADLVASALNVEASTWLIASGPIALELAVIDWFKEWLGYPKLAAGILTSGGSAANLTALACARERAAGAGSEDLVLYFSDQTHVSLARAARVLGFRTDQVRVLPTDPSFRLRLDALEGASGCDVAAGRVPFAVCANAGSTSTGSVDPLGDIAAVCREHGLWLHVDAAYGGFAVLADAGRAALAGIELADSITVDPHKWLFQPFECGCVLVRDGRALPDAFHLSPDYLTDCEVAEVNLYDYGLQLSRCWRALKVWLSVGTFGLAAFRSAIADTLALAEHAAARIEASEVLELVAPASLGVVCFRRRVAGSEADAAAANAALVEAANRSSGVFMTSTRLRGHYALRLCILNHTTSRADVDAALDLIERAPLPDAPLPPPPPSAWELRAGDARLARPRTERDRLREIPLLADLAEVTLDWLVSVSHERRVAAGEVVVEQWDSSRDFYVVLRGSVDVLVDDERVRALGAGEFFGELAARDWGGSYGYARTASVVAAEPSLLLVVPFPCLDELARRSPAADALLRDAARERLAPGRR